MNSQSLRKEGQVIAGPWHEAFGHLVRSDIFFEKIRSSLPEYREMTRITLRVPPDEIPLLRGFKNAGIERIEKVTGAKVVEVRGDSSLAKGHLKVEEL
jgi:flagellar biosynthesis/type III secretory pathway protein FliH